MMGLKFRVLYCYSVLYCKFEIFDEKLGVTYRAYAGTLDARCLY